MHFPFLKLPHELRDEISGHVVESEGSPILKHRDLITKSDLVGVNNQICGEFLDAVLFCAPAFSTTVRKHNFAHVVTFLNRLSEAQSIRFKPPTQDSPTAEENVQRRRIRIVLIYTATKQSSRPQLSRWLNRFDDTTRRGAEIDFEYLFDSTTLHKGGSKQRPHMRTSASDRSNEEVAKVIEAMEEGVRRDRWY